MARELRSRCEFLESYIYMYYIQDIIMGGTKDELKNRLLILNLIE